MRTIRSVRSESRSIRSHSAASPSDGSNPRPLPPECDAPVSGDPCSGTPAAFLRRPGWLEVGAATGASVPGKVILIAVKYVGTRVSIDDRPGEFIQRFGRESVAARMIPTKSQFEPICDKVTAEASASALKTTVDQ